MVRLGEARRVRTAARIIVFGILVAVGIVSWPLMTGAQAGKAARIGVLRPAPDDAVFRQTVEPFRQTLRGSGWVEGANLAIEWRVRAANTREIHSLAGELVRLRVDAIFAMAPAGVAAAAQATKSIPIVAVDLETDPIAAGFVTSLARPGGNVTGIFLDFPELGGKWVQLVREAVPGLTRVAVVWDPATGPSLLKGAEAAARMLNVQVVVLEVRGPRDFAGAFRSAAREKAGALLVLGSPVFNSARKELAELAAKHRLPAIMPFAGFAEDDGFMAYGPHLPTMFQQAGAVMAKILAGIPPGVIPIERPARFELIVNLRAAKALGLTVPNPTLLQADRVIE
jgi:putative ABC transport system substrate-binding protein